HSRRSATRTYPYEALAPVDVPLPARPPLRRRRPRRRAAATWRADRDRLRVRELRHALRLGRRPAPRLAARERSIYIDRRVSVRAGRAPGTVKNSTSEGAVAS